MSLDLCYDSQRAKKHETKSIVSNAPEVEHSGDKGVLRGATAHDTRLVRVEVQLVAVAVRTRMHPPFRCGWLEKDGIREIQKGK